MTPAQLHVYKNRVTEWVVAASPEDAAAALREHHDGSADPEELDLEFRLEPDSKVLRIDEYGVEDGPQEMTCAEWTVKNGRGFLCSTEF